MSGGDDGKIKGSKVPMEFFGDKDELFEDLEKQAAAARRSHDEPNPENFADPFQRGFDPEEQEPDGGISREDYEELRLSMEDITAQLGKLEDRVKGVSNVLVEIYNLLEKLGKSETGEGDEKKPAGNANDILTEMREDLRILIEEGHDVNWPSQIQWLEEGNIRKIFAAIDNKIAVIDTAGKSYSKAVGEATAKAVVKAAIIASLAGSLAGVLAGIALRLI